MSRSNFFVIWVRYSFKLSFWQVWDVVDKGLARGAVGRVPDGEDLEDAVAGLPPVSGSGKAKVTLTPPLRAPR